MNLEVWKSVQNMMFSFILLVSKAFENANKIIHLNKIINKY